MVGGLRPGQVWLFEGRGEVAFMHALLRQLGWFTPNTWALEAYTREFWRGEPLTALALPLALLVGAGLLGWALALRLARRDEVL